MTTPLVVDKSLYTPVEAAHALGVSRSTLYVLMANGHLSSVRIGSSRRIPADGLRHYIVQLGTPAPVSQPQAHGGDDRYSGTSGSDRPGSVVASKTMTARPRGRGDGGIRRRPDGPLGGDSRRNGLRHPAAAQVRLRPYPGRCGRKAPVCPANRR